MTAERYRLLVKYASDLRSALCAYEDKYGAIDLENEYISEIVDAGANLMRLLDSLEPIASPLEEEPFWKYNLFDQGSRYIL